MSYEACKVNVTVVPHHFREKQREGDNKREAHYFRHAVLSS